jgi:hypothetical protein
MAESRNPFHWRGTVTDSTAFVGRQRELTGILTRLRQLGCVSIVGERRIGKSSLAYQACASAPAQLGPDCRAVYIDMLSARHHSLEGLLWAILAGLGAQADQARGDSPEAALAVFESEVRELRKQGMLPVVFLDEFEALGSRISRYGDDLLESWRSLGNNGQIAFVATSARPMDEVTEESGLTSSFYNIFAQMNLGEFSESEASQFARRAVRVGGLEPADETFIRRVGGTHPLRLQVVSWHLWEARRRGEVDFGLLQEQAEAEIAGMMKAK